VVITCRELKKLPNESMKIDILAPDAAIHSEAIYQLIDEEWPGSSERCRLGRIAHSHLDWQNSRIGLLDGRVISYWGVYDLQMQVGAARLRTAGVNLPVTHPEYRRYGFMPQIVASSLQSVRASGYDFSVINNTHAYFTRFGYVAGWPQTHFYINIDDLPTETPKVSFEAVNIQEWIGRYELFALYNKQNERLTGTCVRPTYHHGKIPSSNGQVGYLLRDPSNSIVGYLYDALPDEQNVFYVHTDSAGDTSQRLQVLGVLARQYNLKGVYFHRLHYLSDLAVHLRKLNCQMEVEYRAQSGYLVRVVNLASALQKMSDEISNRVVQSYFAGWSGNLLIKVNDEEVSLCIKEGQVQVCEAVDTAHRIEGGQSIAQLLIGAGEPMEIVTNGDIHLTGDAEHLIEILFPNQHPQMPNEDL